MNERQQRFIDLLNQIFELDKSDLDFGIYRILNIRRDEIKKYFDEKLPAKITEILKPFASADNSALEAQIRAKETALGGAQMIAQLPQDLPMVKEYLELKSQLQQGADLSALESDVYGALYSFFSRYYDEGDFISKRRYKEGVYAIPYEGEEVKLYWANQDQYYIKTSENFKDYTFLAGDYTINFHLVDATTEQNNNKEADDKKRQFMLFTEDEENYPGIKTFDVEDKTVTIRFFYDVPKDPKKKYAEENFIAIKQWLASQPDSQLMMALLHVKPEDKKKQTLLEKHLQGYVAKNSFDYFIHKDLGGFLRRELEFFIKNEIMHLDDIDTDNVQRVETYLAKVRAVKNVGNEIISFLAQMEDFQKKLWLKKKFVVDTQWCITLDKIDESFYEEIRTNKAQIEEWKQMYAIDELQTDLEHTEPFTEVPSILFLKQNQNLIVDTRHFSNDFKLRLVASVENLDEQTNGVMFNADNFQATRLIQTKFEDNIQCVYLDPPYNTGPSEIMYKNGYKESSWLSLMDNRLTELKPLITDDSTIAVAIDDFEMVRMSEMLSELFTDRDRNMVIVNHHPQGTPKDNISRTHEYSVIMTPAGENVMSNVGSIDGFETRALMRSGNSSNNFRSGRPNSFYAILVDPVTKLIMGAEEPPALGVVYPKGETAEGWLRVYPLSKDGTERVWRISYNSKSIDFKNQEQLNKKICCSKSSFSLYQIVTSKKEPINSNWTDKRYNAGTYGTTLLNDIFGYDVFSYPKSLYTVKDYLKATTESSSNDIVLDFFGGSATTGHAVLELNRDDEGNRGYILVEMGTYFDTATLPRIKKVVYSKDWKGGKPVQRNTGISQIVKYMRLESYEDALSNIELKENTGIRTLFGEDYYINYMLDLEAKDSLLNIGAFRTPFSYEMKITEKNESKQRPVDVVETFNYLIGLSVANQGRVNSYNAVPAAQPEYTGAVDLKTANNGEYAFQQIEGKLRDGRRALIIWRTISDDLLAGNAALDAYFQKYRINPQDREFDVIYVNGDNNIENLRQDNEDWKVLRIEEVFNKKMFE